MSLSSLKNNFSKHTPVLKKSIHTLFWFALGGFLGLFFFIGFLAFYYQNTYKDKVYPGVKIDNVDFSGRTQVEVENYFKSKNTSIRETSIQFKAEGNIATSSAKELGIGYDEKLLSTQAISVGRGENVFSNFYILLSAYINGINLKSSFHYDTSKLLKLLKPIQDMVYTKPVDAKFTFEKGRVTEFKTAKQGKEANIVTVQETLVDRVLNADTIQNKTIIINIPIIITDPEVTDDEANSMGIKERIGIGTSLFKGSIENRVYNLTLAANRINGSLVKPGEVFSFNQTVGDISSLSGYKQAYVIQGGRTVLGDGGGVCQVSTTFFRAILNAGLPIIERNPHAYRVGYYEQDSLPGIDAAIYTPSVDLKFKNDTEKHILIQAYVDPVNSQLTFELYGTSDGRVAVINKPVITSQTPAPEPLYQDDPNLPAGEVKQVDFAAPGATVYFTREVTKNGKVIISDKFSTNYRAWQAVYLKGTKQG